MTKIKVGIIGCGTIGSAVAKIFSREFRAQAKLAFLCDLYPDKAVKLARQLRHRVAVVSIDQLIRSSDLVIETAAASVSAGIAKRALALHKQVLILSIGGLLEDSRDWIRAAKRTKGKLWIPSGAVAGIDGLLAAKESGIRHVKLITKKPPQSLRGAPYFRSKKFPVLHGKKVYCVFRGSARQAVKAFPQNINVAGLLSLAGIGAQRTGVEVWTSRAFRFNQHEVVIEGKTGKIRVEMQNSPSPGNPKTSLMAIYSTVAILRKIFSPVHIGT